MPKTPKQLDDEIADALARRKVIQDAARAVRSDLEHAGYGGGRCADASCQLAKRLNAAGIEARVIAGRFKMPESRTDSPHHWVEVDGYVVDPTVDQFQIGFDEQLPKILITAYEDFPHYRKP
jgi:hypothetical protein